MMQVNGRPPTPSWLVCSLLIAIPLLTIDNYFAYHAVGAIGSSLQAYFNLNEEQLASFFTFYSAPNIILVFVGGILMDRFGIIRTTLMFNLCILVGMIIFASTPRTGSYRLAQLLTGRFLLGVGGEALCAGASAMLARWFRSSFLTLAMGVNAALVQLLGSAPAFVLLPFLLGEQGQKRTAPTDNPDEPGTGDTSGDDHVGNVRLCLWMIVVVCAISLIANVIYAVLDERYSAIYVASNMDLVDEFEREVDMDMMRLEQVHHAHSSEADATHQRNDAAAQGKMRQMKMQAANSSDKNNNSHANGSKYHIVQSNELTHVNVRETNDGIMLDSPRQATNTQNGTNNPASPSNGDVSRGEGGSDESYNLLSGNFMRTLWQRAESGSSHLSLWRPWQNLRSLPLLFWLVLAMHCLLSPILYSFSAFGPMFFMEKYGMRQEDASFVTSILYLAIILAPVFGYAIDKFGYRCIVQTSAAGAIPCVFILMHISQLNPYIFVAGLGVAFAVTESNGLAMIAEVSPPSLLGTSYGLLGCAISSFLLFEPYLVGYIHLHTGHYYWSTVLFICISLAGWLMSFIVYVYDVNHDQRMSVSARVKAEDEAAAELAQQANAYPELEIVFDADMEDDEEDEEEFRLDDDVDVDVDVDEQLP